MIEKMNKLRMWGWMLIGLIALAGVAYLSPHQLGVILYKACLVVVAVPLAYYADKSLFARLNDRIETGMKRDMVGAARVIARGFVFFAVLHGVTNGL